MVADDQAIQAEPVRVPQEFTVQFMGDQGNVRGGFAECPQNAQGR